MVTSPFLHIFPFPILFPLAILSNLFNNGQVASAAILSNVEGRLHDLHVDVASSAQVYVETNCEVPTWSVSNYKSCYADMVEA